MRKLGLFGCLSGTILAALLFSAYSQPMQAQSASPGSLENAIEQSHKALAAILNGNPAIYQALFADRDDITLGNPFGPFGKGKAEVAKTLANAASKYHDGSVISVDLVAKYQNENLACIVEIENDRAKVGNSETFAEFHVRVTSLYERINNEWRLVHRHADPITTPRSAESVLGK